MHASTGKTGSGALCVGGGLRIKRPVQLSLSSSWSLCGGDSPSCCQPTQKQGWGLGFPSLQPPGLWPPKFQDTHVDTRWRPRPCPGPTGGPGRRAGSARSPCPWCCAGIDRPAGPPRLGHTRWHARCTCTWEKNMGAGCLQTGGSASRGRVNQQVALAFRGAPTLPLSSRALHAKSLQSCLTLWAEACQLLDHGILQARILEWVAVSSSRESSQPRDQTLIYYVSCIVRRVL